MGIEKSKLRTRNSIFWPGINKQIEDVCKSCNTMVIIERATDKSKIPKYPIQMVGTCLLEWEDLHFVAG